MKLLEGKVALITGGASGIGYGIAEVFCEHGAHVAILDSDAQRLPAAVAELRPAAGQQVLGLAVNVADPEAVADALQRVVDALGDVHVLVNCAAVMRNYDIIDFPLEEWRRVFQVNVEGVFLCSQLFARQLIRQGTGGSIINISSCAANKADRKHAAYSASKAAVITFTRILALELGAHGIRANAILPGATGPTQMLESVFAQVPGIREELIGRTVLGKLATPRDQGNAALFLASDLASHITGEYLIVAGGEFMNA